MGTNRVFVRVKQAQSRVQGSGRWERKSASFLRRDGERKSLRFHFSRVLLFSESDWSRPTEREPWVAGEGRKEL